MIDLHVTPDEFNQLQDAIDQSTRTALLLTHWHDRLPMVDVYSIVSGVLGDEVAQSIGFRCARLVVHFDSAPIHDRIQEAR